MCLTEVGEGVGEEEWSEAPCALARLLAALLFARLIRATRHMRRMRNIPQCATFKLHTLHAALARKMAHCHGQTRPGQAINRIDVKSFKCHWPSASFRTLLLPLSPPLSPHTDPFCLPGFLPAVTFIYGPLDLLYKLPVELLR